MKKESFIIFAIALLTWLGCTALAKQDQNSTSSDVNASDKTDVVKIAPIAPPQTLMVPPMAYDDSSIILIWSKPSDYSNAASYNVYKNGALAGNTKNLFYEVSGLDANSSYSFTVKAAGNSGTESAASNTVTQSTAPAMKVFNVADYGALGDGTTLNTAAIQKAIDKCTKGGKVLIPSGTFLSGALFLKSNMTLQIDGTLLGSNDPADYPYTSLRFPYYASGNNYMGLVNAYYNYTDRTSAGQPYGTITNVRICGSGVINGCQGYSASSPHDVTVNTGSNTTLGFAEIDIHGVPNRGDMVTIKGVNQVYLGGWGGSLTMVYPAEHTIFVSYCNGVTVADVNCDTYDIANGDGIDLCTTDTAYIFNSKFDTGDDCINMNAGQGLEGKNPNVGGGVPDQNIRVFDCSTDRGHGGYVIGSFTAAWVQDSLVEDCFFKNTDTSNGIGIRMKTGARNGGGARRITCRDIRISGPSKQGIFLDSTYNQTDYGDAGPGQFSGNIFKNISVTATGASIFVNGWPGPTPPAKPHTNNTFYNITGNKAASLTYCTNSTFNYCTVVGSPAWNFGTGTSGLSGTNNTPQPTWP